MLSFVLRILICGSDYSNKVVKLNHKGLQLTSYWTSLNDHQKLAIEKGNIRRMFDQLDHSVTGGAGNLEYPGEGWNKGDLRLLGSRSWRHETVWSASDRNGINTVILLFISLLFISLSAPRQELNAN